MWSHAQFVCWRLESYPGEAKPRKVPYSPSTGQRASTTDPATWGSYEAAIAAYLAGGFSGIGFVFTMADRFAFIDIDDCLAADGQWLPHAAGIMQALPGAWEVSQSGRGLHGIGMVGDKAALIGLRNKWTLPEGQKMECYLVNRFMAIGGRGWSGTVSDWTWRLPLIVPARAAHEVTGAPVEWKDEPRADWEGPADDDELIARAIATRSPLGIAELAAPFAALWNASPLLGEFWPDEHGGRLFDHSSADLALANALAWWTGCNPVRMMRLFKRSSLWRGDERKARLAIGKAISDPNRSYRKRRDRLAEDAAIGETGSAENAPTILTLEQAARDLVFVAGGSVVIHRPTKRARSLADANADFAASQHEFDSGEFDATGRPKIKRIPVMKAWIASTARLTVDAATWRPGEGEFCSTLERGQGGDRAYNLWTPPAWWPAPADWPDRVKPFLDHIAYLVPVEAERAAFLCWLAHIFQRPGELPHVHYLMVTKQTGTGRGTLAGILARALRGYVAINADPATLFGGFNGRISQKLLATVDEIREGNSAARYEKAESLKSKITEETRAINPKYGLQSVEKNCCRWLMFSNHMDALPFDNKDRRIIVIENPSTRAQPEWYQYLHTLMNDPAFIASVQKWALSHDIGGWSAHAPAPMNAAKAKALKALESPLDAACRQFATEWPGGLAAVSDLARFVGGEPNARALSHAIERTGMATARRIKSNGQQETVLIVRGPLTEGDLEPVNSAILMGEIIRNRGKFAIS